MKVNIDSMYKKRIELSYRQFVFKILILLGFSPSSKGTYYLRDIILLALIDYNFSDTDINLTKLRNNLSKAQNVTETKIKASIEYSFKYIDKYKAKENFSKIFGFEYDDYYITAKSIVNLIVGLIYTKEIKVNNKN